MNLHDEILKTLLYYDIWSYPLTRRELYAFLPVNSCTFESFEKQLAQETESGAILHHNGYYFVKGKGPGIVRTRLERTRHAKRMWIMARLAMHIIKRFPFVRAVFVSGDLSKNATVRKSDIDFFVITEPRRLWIARTLLILFKKVFLLNRKKFFCLNYFAAADHLELDDRNVFLATEIVHLKPLFNSRTFGAYLDANKWVRDFFPNFDIRLMPMPAISERPSHLQRLLEWPFRLFDADRLDERLMKKMEQIWAKRYPEFDEETRSRIFRCTPHESRAYAGNYQERILALYEQRLKEFGIET